MRIDPKTTIAGQPAVRVRDFLRSSGSDLWSLDFVQKQFKIDPAAAQVLVEELLRLGLVEQTPEYSDGQYWRMTGRGSTFSLASAAKPVRRQTAEDALSGFLQRVHKVNSDPRFIYRAVKVVLFGSYLTAEDRLGDVDLGVTLKSKEPNARRREALEDDHIKRALDSGRRFRNIVEQLFWPKFEVLQYLKAGSRVISLHESDDPVKLGAKRRVIYERSGT